MESFRSPVTLTGRWIRLVPLAPDHASDLRAVAVDPEVARFLFPGPGKTPGEMEALIEFLLERQKAGTELPFATVLRTDDRPIGMTRYLHIDRTNRSVEVGGTWLDARLERTPLPTELEYLLLRHAFEAEKVHRISLRADARDERSQRSIARLGAVREAVFRDDAVLPDGSFRSSVVYGILAAEWPHVRDALEAMLAHEWTPPELGGPAAGSGGLTREGQR